MGKEKSRVSPIRSSTHSFVRQTPGVTVKESAKECKVSKVTLVVTIPIIALFALTFSTFTNALLTLFAAQESTMLINEGLVVTDTVGKMQVERGLTSMYLGSNATNQDAAESLRKARLATDDFLAQVSMGFPLTLVVPDIVIASKDQLSQYIQVHRDQVDTAWFDVPFEQNLNFYTDITLALLGVISADVQVDREDKTVVALDALLHAADSQGIRRALGSTFWGKCFVTNDERGWFQRLDIVSDIQLDTMARQYFPAIEEYIQGLHRLDPLQDIINNMTRDIMADDFSEVCASTETSERFIISDWWFKNLTQLMGNMGDTRLFITSELKAGLLHISNGAKTSLIIYSLVLTLAIVTSFMTLSFVNSLTSKVSRMTEALVEEQSRTDALLNQMVPKAVAEQLKSGKTVEAEHFDMASIYFSDIVGFTVISSQMTAAGVIRFLNALYGVFDQTIDNFDVYKVETIGDAYMCASGLPTRNGDLHAPEISAMALSIRESVQNFKWPSLSDGLQIRIGLHSGPCAAGVVGQKMPRYCLFGDTVNTASRMESHGKAMKIHITDVTYQLLVKYGGFDFERRGTTDIKGKGKMETYWLTGCDANRRESHVYCQSSVRSSTLAPSNGNSLPC